MFKITNQYTVEKSNRISEIFNNGLPVNAFIDKGRCAIGGTHSELYNQKRCSIIVVPNISIIEDKLNNLQEIDGVLPTLEGVWGKVRKSEVVDIMKIKHNALKIMTTPEGIRKIIYACEKVGRLEELYQSWFLLLDEAHTFISEAYRKDILAPFDYFWQFQNKSIISATPYYFSDPRFSQLELHKITFGKQKLGKVTLVNASNVVGTLNYLIQNAHEFPGNIHIFYNSVTEIKDAVLRAKLEDCSIFCADDKDRLNIRKLEDAGIGKFFKDVPSNTTYSKLNFYTCKYFEGWDLYDKDAAAVLVTNVYKPHTKIGVGSKGKQAVGRLRDKPYQIIHITNYLGKASKRSLEEIKENYRVDADLLIQQHNEFVNRQKTGKFTENPRLKLFSHVNDVTKIATIHPNLLDQQINEASNNEIYNHIDFIKEDWEKAYFEVEMQTSYMKLDSKTTLSRKSKRYILKEDIDTLDRLKDKGQSIFFIGSTPIEQQIEKRNPLAYKAWKLLSPDELSSLDYKVKEVEKMVIQRENTDKHTKLLHLLKREFNHQWYFNYQIEEKLQNLYKDLEIKDKSNKKVKKAQPNQLADSGFFIIKGSKRKDTDGKEKYGYYIEGYQLEMKLID